MHVLQFSSKTLLTADFGAISERYYQGLFRLLYLSNIFVHISQTNCFNYSIRQNCFKVAKVSDNE